MPRGGRLVRATSDGPGRGSELRVCSVLGLLLHGERDIVLDLACVARIDAAGVGELIRAYNTSAAAGGSLRIVHATRWVREVLERVQLFELLSGSVAQVR